MTTYTVKDTAGLLGALKTVKNGDTVYLQGGTYSSVNLKGIQLAGNVTITSLDAGKPAVLTDLSIKDSKGLTLRGLELAANPAKTDMPFQVWNSSSIVMDKLYVHGTLNGSAADDVRGLLVRNSSNVTVANSRFEQLADAVSHIDSNGVTFTGNRFENLRDNGIVGGGTSNLKISGNVFSDFDHSGSVHPDAIQVWTTNTKASVSNIDISGNVIDRGAGSVVQGIWMRDEVGNLPFKNVTISNNTIVGAAYNGIGVMGVAGLKLSGNTVVGRDDQASWISIQNATGAVVSDNVASKISYVNAQASKAANMLMGAASDTVAHDLSNWLAGNVGATDLAGKLDAQIVAKVGLSGSMDGTADAARPVAATPQPGATVLTGTAGADRLTAGASGDYRLDGGAGNDTLTGGGKGVTTMNGGAGDDTYVVKSAKDVVVEGVGAGTDTVVTYVDHVMGANVETVRLGAGGLTVHGNDLGNMMTGADGADTLYGEAGNDTLQGGAGGDALHGGVGNDTLKGDGGDDTLLGEDGNDLLYGGAGDDVLNGGAGNNQLEGGAGADRLYGGSGQDTFVFRTTDFQSGAPSVDDVFGFSSAQKDKIHLGMIDAKSATVADDSFRFIGTSAFHNVAGELRYEVVGGDAYVMGDTNGDAVADFMIHLVYVTSLSASDFAL